MVQRQNNHRDVSICCFFFFFQAEDGIRDVAVTGFRRVLFRLDGSMAFVNAAGARMLGYTPEELIDQPMHARIHYAHPDGSPFPREECKMYMTAHDGQHRLVSDEVLWRKDGSNFPVEYTATPILK